MIISFSKNFAFIRIPKTGSTSAVTALYDSGILDSSIDICTGIEDGSFGSTKDEPDGLRSSDGTGRDPINYHTNYNILDENLLNQEHKDILEKGKKSFKKGERVSLLQTFKAGDSKLKINIAPGLINLLSIHNTWNMIEKNNLTEKGMNCISTIRHPVDRFVSICYFYEHGTRNTLSKKIKNESVVKEYEKLKYGRNVLKEEGIDSIVEKFRDGITMFSEYDSLFQQPQHYWLNDNPVLWNTENVMDWTSEFLNKNGLAIKEKIWAKKQNRPRDYLNPNIMSLQNQKYLLDRYEKDFLAWEKSYKRFN